MDRTIKYREQEATSGGEQALQYQALVEKLKPKMAQSLGECCEKPENIEKVGSWHNGEVMGSRGWHGQIHHIEECRVCGRVRIPAPYMFV